MEVHHDYRCISDFDRVLMKHGYSKLYPHNISFIRCFNDEEAEKNAKAAETLPAAEWKKYCNQIEDQLADFMEIIAESLAELYKFKNFSGRKFRKTYTGSDWDFHFSSHVLNRNEAKYDSFMLTFFRETPEENFSLLKEILPIIESLSLKNIECVVVYAILLDQEKIASALAYIKDEIEIKSEKPFGRPGKLKRKDGRYGFYKPYAKHPIYEVSNSEALAAALQSW